MSFKGPRLSIRIAHQNHTSSRDSTEQASHEEPLAIELQQILRRPILGSSVWTFFLTIHSPLADNQQKINRLRQISRQLPKGPSRTKNPTESEFRYGEKIRYRRSKTLRRGLRNACFLGKRGRKTVYRKRKTMAVAKYYRFERRTIFSTEGSFRHSNHLRFQLRSLPLFPKRSAVPERGRSKRGRTQKHANVRKRGQMSENASPQKSTKERKRAQKRAEERFRVKIANYQV